MSIRNAKRKKRRGNSHKNANHINKKLNVACLNMNSASSSVSLSKWAILEHDVLHEQEVQVLLLSETRLMNQDVPPYIMGYRWIGSNRQGLTGRRAHGGVGIIIANNYEEILIEKGDDWIATILNINKKRRVFVSVYVKHTSLENNKRSFTKISEF